MLGSPFAWSCETRMWSRAGRDTALGSAPKKSGKGHWLRKPLGASLLSLELGQPVCSSFEDFLATSVLPDLGALPCPSSLSFQSTQGCPSLLFLLAMRSMKAATLAILLCLLFILYCSLTLLFYNYLYFTGIMRFSSLHSPRLGFLVASAGRGRENAALIHLCELFAHH